MHFSLPVDDSLLKIETTACDYFDYSSSMAVLKADANGTLEAFLGTPAKLRAQYKVTNTTFNNPVVCGALGVVTLPITQDGYALIFRRGDQVADYASLHGVVGEGFHPIKDKTRSAENDTFQLSAKVAIRRSLKEELGLEKETIKKTAILGLGVSSDSMDPTLLCIAHLNANLAEVKKNAAENSARDRWELGTCEATRWRPRPISLYLRTIGVPRFTPPVPAVLYLGLLHDFDHREVKKAFAA